MGSCWQMLPPLFQLAQKIILTYLADCMTATLFEKYMSSQFVFVNLLMFVVIHFGFIR